MYIYHTLITALNTHMIHIDLNTIFYTHVEHSLAKAISVKLLYGEHTHTHTHNAMHSNMYDTDQYAQEYEHARTCTHTHTHTHTLTVAETAY